MLDIYLADRPVTDDNLAQIARHLAASAKKMRAADAPLFLNLLRGCEIPAGIFREIAPGVEIVDIPLSVDEVPHDTALKILDEFLPAEKYSERDLFWLDEALGLGMGQAVLKLLHGYFGENLKSLDVVFLAAENGQYIDPRFKASVDKTVESAGGKITVEFKNVDYIHWMDNNRLLGMNWGRRYTLPRFWPPAEVAADLRNRLESYRPGPMRTVKVGTPEFEKYRARLDDFVAAARPVLEPHGYKFESGKVFVPDGGEREIPPLENHINDPHALWCKRQDGYAERYDFLVSDPKLMLDLGSPDAGQYRKQLLEAVKKIM
ncbi:MAG: hypothetical protein E3J72_21300 [Planctomycetota bacterium]|nr:MAG: hypothetical protein E3J72_21300 [Planctomycetota bacterium]